MIIDVLNFVSEHITVSVTHVVSPVAKAICKPSFVFLFNEFDANDLASVLFIVVSKLFKKQLIGFNHLSPIKNFLKGLINVFSGFCLAFPYFKGLCDVLLLFESFVFEIVVRKDGIIFIEVVGGLCFFVLICFFLLF
jgi:hypothetical protein